MPRRKEMIYHGLTLKQKKFADEYIISGNATEAAIKAGYSEKTARSVGSENLTKPDIQNYVEKRLAKTDKKKIADQEEILSFLTSVMRDDEILSKDRLKAAELLGKNRMLWVEKQSIKVNKVENPLEGLSTDELKELIKDG